SLSHLAVCVPLRPSRSIREVLFSPLLCLPALVSRTSHSAIVIQSAHTHVHEGGWLTRPPRGCSASIGRRARYVRIETSGKVHGRPLPLGCGDDDALQAAEEHLGAQRQQRHRDRTGEQQLGL